MVETQLNGKEAEYLFKRAYDKTVKVGVSKDFAKVFAEETIKRHKTLFDRLEKGE